MISARFLKSSAIYSIGGALPMITSVLLLPFYSNFLNASDFVALGLYVSISLLYQVFFSYSLDVFIGIKYSQLHQNAEERKRFVGTTSGLLLLIGVGLTLISMLIGPFLFPYVFHEGSNVEFGTYAVASILTGFFNSYFKTASNFLIYLQKPSTFLTYAIINFISTFGIAVAGLYIFPDSLIGPVAARFISGLIIFFLGYQVFRTNATFVIDKKYFREINAFCLPYLFYALSIWAVTNIDRIFLVNAIDKVSLAGYDQLMKCTLGIEFFQNSISAIIYPKVYELWSKGGKMETSTESNRYFNVFSALNILALIAFCIVIPPLLELFVKKTEYYESFDYIGLIVAGYATRTILSFYMAGILFGKSTHMLLKIFGISSLIQILLTYFAVNHFGLIGAIYTGIAAKIIQVILAATFAGTAFKYNFNVVKIYLIPLLFLILNVILYFSYNEYNISIYMIQLLVFSVIFFVIFRKEVAALWQQFRK